VPGGLPTENAAKRGIEMLFAPFEYAALIDQLGLLDFKRETRVG
jgi:hypothetical protein